MWRSHFRGPEGLGVVALLQSTIGDMDRANAPSLAAIFENVIKEGMTFYDASYPTAAVEGGYRLVTDDEKLFRAARRYLNAPRSSDLV